MRYYLFNRGYRFGISNSCFYFSFSYRISFSLGDVDQRATVPTDVDHMGHRRLFASDDQGQHLGCLGVSRERGIALDHLELFRRQEEVQVVTLHSHLVGIVVRDCDHVFRVQTAQDAAVTIEAAQVLATGHMQTVGALVATVVIHEGRIHLHSYTWALWHVTGVDVSVAELIVGTVQQLVVHNAAIIRYRQVTTLDELQQILNGVLTGIRDGSHAFQQSFDTGSLTSFSSVSHLGSQLVSIGHHAERTVILLDHSHHIVGLFFSSSHAEIR